MDIQKCGEGLRRGGRRRVEGITGERKEEREIKKKRERERHWMIQVVGEWSEREQSDLREASGSVHEG